MEPAILAMVMAAFAAILTVGALITRQLHRISVRLDSLQSALESRPTPPA